MSQAVDASLTVQRLGDAKQVGARTGMSWRTVYRYADAGLMPWGLKIGTLRRWDLDEIERWISIFGKIRGTTGRSWSITSTSNPSPIRRRIRRIMVARR